MAVPVIDISELVEIAEQHQQVVAGGKFGGQPLGKAATGERTGEWVVHRQSDHQRGGRQLRMAEPRWSGLPRPGSILASPYLP